MWFRFFVLICLTSLFFKVRDYSLIFLSCTIIHDSLISKYRGKYTDHQNLNHRSPGLQIESQMELSPLL